MGASTQECNGLAASYLLEYRTYLFTLTENLRIYLKAENGFQACRSVGQPFKNKEGVEVSGFVY